MKRIFPRVSIASAHILNANIREIKSTMKQNGHLFMNFCKNDQKKQRLFCRDFFSFRVFKSFFPKNSFKSRFLPVRLQRQSFLQRLVVAVSQSQIQSHKTAARARMEALTLWWTSAGGAQLWSAGARARARARALSTNPQQYRWAKLAFFIG